MAEPGATDQSKLPHHRQRAFDTLNKLADAKPLTDPVGRMTGRTAEPSAAKAEPPAEAATPAEDELQKEAQKFAEILKTQGEYRLAIKASPKWTIGGKPIQEVLPRAEMYMAGAIDAQNCPLDKWVPREGERVLGGGYLMQFLSDGDKYDSLVIASYVPQYDPENEDNKRMIRWAQEKGETKRIERIQSKFPLNGSYECVYKVICVEGGADPYATGRPNPLNFSFRVPADASSEFLLQIRQRPELMNAIFDSIYPGLLSDNHLRAKPAEGLALHALGKQDLDSNNYYPKSQHYLKSPVEKLKYPQPIK